MVSHEPDIFHFRKIPEDWKFTEKHEIPVVKGFVMNPKKELELTPFNEFYAVAKTKRKNKIVHFFLADYLFERAWSRLDDTAEFIASAKAVLSPDFSIYTDMPLEIQRFNHYRKMFIHKYWEYFWNMRVIPTACWSDERSFDFCFEGMPKRSLVAVSSVGVIKNKEAQANFAKGYNRMIEVLEPKQILWYGKEMDCIDSSIQHFFVEPRYEERFKK